VDWRGALHNNALVKLPQAMLLETEEPRSHAQVPRHASLSYIGIFIKIGLQFLRFNG
jgi:hypothetical protein